MKDIVNVERNILQLNNVKELNRQIDVLIKKFAEVYASGNTDNLTKDLNFYYNEQKYAVNKCNVDVESIVYALGKLDGLIKTIDMLLYYVNQWKEFEEENVIADNSKHLHSILQFLQKNNRMSHTELANALGVSVNNLTNTMERIMPLGVVKRERFGKYCYYYITEKGKNYLYKFGQKNCLKPYKYEQIVGIRGDVGQLPEELNTNISHLLSSKMIQEIYYQAMSGDCRKKKKVKKLLDKLKQANTSRYGFDEAINLNFMVAIFSGFNEQNYWNSMVHIVRTNGDLPDKPQKNNYSLVLVTN